MAAYISFKVGIFTNLVAGLLKVQNRYGYMVLSDITKPMISNKFNMNQPLERSRL
jgi:hypothetical protein